MTGRAARGDVLGDLEKEALLDRLLPPPEPGAPGRAISIRLPYARESRRFGVADADALEPYQEGGAT